MHISAQQQEAQKRIKTQMWTFLCFTTNVNRKPVGAFIVEAAAVGICASRDGHGPHLTARSDNGHAGSSCTIVAGATEREQGQKCLQCSCSWTAGIPAAAAALPSSAMLQTTIVLWLLEWGQQKLQVNEVPASAHLQDFLYAKFFLLK